MKTLKVGYDPSISLYPDRNIWNIHMLHIHLGYEFENVLYSLNLFKGDVTKSKLKRNGIKCDAIWFDGSFEFVTLRIKQKVVVLYEEKYQFI